MTWNYRVCKTAHGVGDDLEEVYSIHEVYYEGERIKGWSENPSYAQGETHQECFEDLTRMIQAFSRPTLDLTGEKPVEMPRG